MKPVHAPSSSRPARKGRSPLARAAPLAGSAGDLPDDASTSLDHALYGTPKRQPRVGRWISAKAKASRMTAARARDLNKAMDRLAAEVGPLPADLARNHDHYLHGQPKS